MTTTAMPTEGSGTDKIVWATTAMVLLYVVILGVWRHRDGSDLTKWEWAELTLNYGLGSGTIIIFIVYRGPTYVGDSLNMALFNFTSAALLQLTSFVYGILWHPEEGDPALLILFGASFWLELWTAINAGVERGRVGSRPNLNRALAWAIISTTVSFAYFVREVLRARARAKARAQAEELAAARARAEAQAAARRPARS